MAVDRKAKQKKKREAKQRAFRGKTSRLHKIRQAEELGWMASDAYDQENYTAALSFGMKSLKLNPSDSEVWNMAFWCARHLGEESSLYTLLDGGMKEGFIEDDKDSLLFGKLAMKRGEYDKAREAFESVVRGSYSAGRGMSQGETRDAIHLLEYCRNLERFERSGASPTVDVPTRKRKKGSEAAKRAPSRGHAVSEEAPDRQEGEKGRHEKQEPAEPKASPAQRADETKLALSFELKGERVLAAVEKGLRTDCATLDLALEAYLLSFRTSYDQLICIPTLRNVRSLWYQEDTARKVMKTFRGRAILADEVGLGKTIEAGLVLKEYILRGLVHSALILAPSALVNQWGAELHEKFDLPFVTSNDPMFRRDPARFWKEPYLLVSLQTARTKRHFDAATSRAYDLVIVDEAHHVKNRSTSNFKLVNALQKTFLLLLTATPVQNKLEELYNLVTLLRPGHLKTRKGFMEEFVTRGNPTDPRNREKLRQLLKEVMIRNTRSVTQLKLPPRFATTIRVDPQGAEADFYRKVSAFVSDHAGRPSEGLPAMTQRKLLEAAGSSPFSAIRMLTKIREKGGNGSGDEAKEVIEVARGIDVSAKTTRVLELLAATKEQTIIFVNHIATFEHLHEVLTGRRIRHVLFRGGLSPAEKTAAVDAFREGCPVLLASGVGGEGQNLQFCSMMINYDLPWNPMEIEQRIGRIHRIGQEKEVEVYNFCTAGSLEDHILEVLDRKINMFELVVGEIDMILGRVRGEQEFGEMVFDIWTRHHDDEPQRSKAFEGLAARLKRARTSYEKSKELDEKLFREDFGV